MQIDLDDNYDNHAEPHASNGSHALYEIYYIFFCGFKFDDDLLHLYLPAHFTSTIPTFGSHSPFSMHVVIFGPISVFPGAQLNVMVAPSNAGLSRLSAILTELLATNGYSHLAGIFTKMTWLT